MSIPLIIKPIPNITVEQVQQGVYAVLNETINAKLDNDWLLIADGCEMVERDNIACAVITGKNGKRFLVFVDECVSGS